MSKKKQWYKLDLSANVYPTLQRKQFSSVYRISVTLTEKIKPQFLQLALEKTLPRFPNMKVAMRKGVFWRYLEPNENPIPKIQPDICNPCMPMHMKGNNRYLLRIYYYDRQISLEAFHSLADGYGGLVFLKTLAAVYLQTQGISIPNDYGVLNIDEEADPGELEDAYIKYANSKVLPARSQGKAYRIRSTKEPFYTLNVISGNMRVEDLKTVSKGYKVTITEYLNSVLLYALLQKQKSDKVRKEKPVKIAMPVDLRRLFPSNTLRNFITMIYPGIDPRLGEYTFEEILKQTHHFMRYYINDKFLNADITTNAYTQQNIWVRVVPLFIKDFVVRQFYIKVQDKQSTAGLTNLGIVETPEEMKGYIERFDVLMGQPFSPRTNCAVISFQGVTTINFASSIVESDVERYFFRKLVEDGVPVTIRSNRK